jgi:transposase
MGRRRQPPPPACSRCPTLERENRRLQRQVERLERDQQRLAEKLARCQEDLEAARRAGKRQAAPFSKGEPKKRPRRPGRRRGAAHGPAAFRPPPERIHEVLDAPLPERCPRCGGAIAEEAVASQFQTELPPVVPRFTQIQVHIGHCQTCRLRVQGRHPRQTSDALGAAASQVGPRALALAADLHKGLGLSLEKTCRVLQRGFGLSLSRGGLYLGLERLARAAEPTYQALIAQLRGAPWVSPDETGWKLGGRLVWLWVFATKELTLYAIQPGRGFAEAAAVLGEDFEGLLVRDGWAPYRKFEQAGHQSCLAHLLRRCQEILDTAQRGSARVPRAVQRLLQRALALGNRRDRGDLRGHGLAVAVGRLRAKMDRLLAWNPKDEANRKLLAHLRTERDALFTFLAQPGLPATNWPAEQGIRPAVVTRKACGGNRTWNGAHTQQVLSSVLATSHKQRLDPYPVLVALLRSLVPVVAEELLPAQPKGP